MTHIVIAIVAPLILAPFAAWGLSWLFCYFLTEAEQLFDDHPVSEADIRPIAALLAKADVGVFVLVWLVFFACDRFAVPTTVLTIVGLSGIALAFLITVFLIRINLDLKGWILWEVSLLAFVGGNLPLLLLIPIVLFTL